MSNIRLFHPENIIENTTSLLSKEHTHYIANVMSCLLYTSDAADE